MGIIVPLMAPTHPSIWPRETSWMQSAGLAGQSLQPILRIWQRGRRNPARRPQRDCKCNTAKPCWPKWCYRYRPTDLQQASDQLGVDWLGTRSFCLDLKFSFRLGMQGRYWAFLLWRTLPNLRRWNRYSWGPYIGRGSSSSAPLASWLRNKKRYTRNLLDGICKSKSLMTTLTRT